MIWKLIIRGESGNFAVYSNPSRAALEKTLSELKLPSTVKVEIKQVNNNQANTIP